MHRESRVFKDCKAKKENLGNVNAIKKKSIFAIDQMGEIQKL